MESSKESVRDLVLTVLFEYGICGAVLYGLVKMTTVVFYFFQSVL